jgi:hypothetical protein
VSTRLVVSPISSYLSPPPGFLSVPELTASDEVVGSSGLSANGAKLNLVMLSAFPHILPPSLE